jgi:prepilin-type processing-associated H-X9-DG protein
MSEPSPTLGEPSPGMPEKSDAAGRARDPRRPRRIAIAGMILFALAAGILAAAILLSWNRANETANRYRCGSMLRSLGQAFLLYASDNAGALPPDLNTLRQCEDLTRGVFICPSSGDQVSTPNQGSYIYCGANWNIGPDFSDRSHDDAVLMYEPLSHHHQGMQVLFGDGHVMFEMMTPQQVAAFERELRAGQNPPPTLSLPSVSAIKLSK